MVGKVIEGRYAGANICKLPEKNYLFIETEDGERIALSKINVISIDDVTKQHSSNANKVLMVMWNNLETSVIQLGMHEPVKTEYSHYIHNTTSSVSSQREYMSNISTATRKSNITAFHKAKDNRKSVVIVACASVIILLLILLLWLRNSDLQFISADNDALSTTMPTESDIITTEAIIIPTESNTPVYYWHETKHLSFPLADVQITTYKVENIEGATPAYSIEIICESMTSLELIEFMINSTEEWGFDRISLAEQIQKVLDMYDDAWTLDTMMYCSMSGYGIEWTVSLGTDDHFCGIVGLTVNKPNEFEAVLGMMPQDTSTEENTVPSDKETLHRYSIEYVLSNWNELIGQELCVEGWVLSHNTVQYADSKQWRSWCTIYSSTEFFPSVDDSTTLSADWLINGYDPVGLEVALLTDSPVDEITTMQTGDYVRVTGRIDQQESESGYFVSLALQTIEIIPGKTEDSSQITSFLLDDAGNLVKPDAFIDRYEGILDIAHQRYYGQSVSINKVANSGMMHNYAFHFDGKASSTTIGFSYEGSDTLADGTFDQINILHYAGSNEDTSNILFCITTLMSMSAPSAGNVWDYSDILGEMIEETTNSGSKATYEVDGVVYTMNATSLGGKIMIAFAVNVKNFNALH